MRLPSLSGMWPGRAATSSSELEQPQMTEATRSHDDIHPREPVRSRRSTVLSLGREDSRSPLTARPGQADSGAAREEVESPKTPRFRLGMLSFTSSRLQLPHLSRTGTAGSNAMNSQPASASAHQSQTALDEPPPRFPSAFFEPTMSRVVAEPEPTAMAPEPQARSRMSSFSGATLREEPRDLGYEEAHVRGAIVGHSDEGAGVEEYETSRRFMGCFPRVRSRRVRTQITWCLVSGLFLVALLATYLALSITGSIVNNELSILLILIIIFTTIFFCHSLIRLCMLVTRPRRDDEDRQSSPLPGVMAFAGFSLPRRPIRVVLARDEEAAGIESETTKIRPPAYGVWRESVRVDPDRLFWQRSQTEQQGRPAPPEAITETRSLRRPPSYASDDGVGYVVDAAPRSTAPTAGGALPVHPSERGRWDGQEAPW